jgi:hypothetical protein
VFRHDKITTEQNHNDNRFVEKAAKFKHLGMIQNCIHEECKSRLNLGKHLLPFSSKFLSSHLLSVTALLSLLYGVGKFGLHVGNTKSNTQNEE